MLQIIFWVLIVFTALLLARLVFDYVKVIAKTWQPSGPVLLVHDIAYGATDPGLKFIRKGVPPLRINSEVRLDTAFLILMLVCSILLNVVGSRV